MTASPKLSVTGLTKRYAGDSATSALENVSFTVNEGEILMLVGPSGCGKSTLLSLIAGLSVANSGEIRLDGKHVTGPGPDRGVVFQDGALFPWLNVRQNVEFGLRQAGVPAPQRLERADRFLEKVGLQSFANHSIHELSGGMRQRVALARCLVMEPEIVLMDEPFSALDAITREDLYGELQDIWQDRTTTVVFVTHNVREAVTLGDRVLLMSPRPGRIQAEFPIEILRPRQIDDVDVARQAQQISVAMKYGPHSNHESDHPNRLLRESDRSVGADRGS